MTKFKYVLIGCGRISNKHLEALAANSAMYEPVGFVDIIEQRAIDAVGKVKQKLTQTAPAYYTDYRKMMLELKPDVVAIATESGYHAEIACDILKSGANVILEKPMALSTTDCDRIIEAANKTGKKVTVCFQNRFNPPIQKLRTAVEKGMFENIYHGQVSIRWNRNKEYYEQAAWRCTWELDGGALMNQCSHGIDLLQWMMGGKITSVYGVLRKYNSPREAEDFGSAIVEFDNGKVGIIEGSVVLYPNNLEEKLSIFGAKGTVVIGGLAVNHIETWRIEGEQTANIEPRNDPQDVYGSGHAPLYKNFYDAIINDKKPYISAEDGRTAVEIILAVYKSMKEKRRIDFPVSFSTLEMKEIGRL